jgi:hypothetical protein
MQSMLFSRILSNSAYYLMLLIELIFHFSQRSMKIPLAIRQSLCVHECVKSNLDWLLPSLNSWPEEIKR